MVESCTGVRAQRRRGFINKLEEEGWSEMPTSTTQELGLNKGREEMPAGRTTSEAQTGFPVVPERFEAKANQIRFRFAGCDFANQIRFRFARTGWFGERRYWREG